MAMESRPYFELKLPGSSWVPILAALLEVKQLANLYCLGVSGIFQRVKDGYEPFDLEAILPKVKYVWVVKEAIKGDVWSSGRKGLESEASKQRIFAFGSRTPAVDCLILVR